METTGWEWGGRRWGRGDTWSLLNILAYLVMLQGKE